MNHATPSGFVGLACFFAATIITSLRGYRVLDRPATTALLQGLEALDCFLIAQLVIFKICKVPALMHAMATK